MEWQADGIILEVSSYGETSYLVEIFTQTHGKERGIFRKNKKSAAMLQLGRFLKITWKARLESQLGTWTLEDHLLQPIRFASLLENPLGLTALLSLSSLCKELIPERQLYPRLYEGLQTMLQALNGPSKQLIYGFFRFKLLLLKELGYGLDFSKCAVTGQQTCLTHVSPHTGKGVCAEIAKLYPGKLIELPLCLYDSKASWERLSTSDIEKSFDLFSFFLKKWLMGQHSVALKRLERYQIHALEVCNQRPDQRLGAAPQNC
jgi:DNA repair protein RecO (recombination protein O)